MITQVPFVSVTEAHPEEAGVGIVPSLPAGLDTSPAVAQQLAIQEAMADGVTTFTELANAGDAAAVQLKEAMGASIHDAVKILAGYWLTPHNSVAPTQPCRF